MPLRAVYSLVIPGRRVAPDLESIPRSRNVAV